MPFPFPSSLSRWRVQNWLAERSSLLAVAAALVVVARLHPILRFLAAYAVVRVVTMDVEAERERFEEQRKATNKTMFVMALDPCAVPLDDIKRTRDAAAAKYATSLKADFPVAPAPLNDPFLAAWRSTEDKKKKGKSGG